MTDRTHPASTGGQHPLPGHTSHEIRTAAVLDARYKQHFESFIDPSVDQPDRYESFLLGEGEKKVEVEQETRVPNAAMFTFNKEDHTLGNLLRAKLAKADHVLFAGYQVPHPLFATFKLRVQTDGEITPKEAVVTACQDLVKELGQLDQEFTKEMELKKIAGAGGDL
ncbi:hypothetical protein CERZMDRAFT_41122 [Cercospora zeae-maydis SCOH1-5]|uniref:DNA-directed RNA polymerase RBP11-like dimerisation domain-containing protein n=1 Tax=Cercospora zeae-maydis SCOH1-5 TaxID=717836 RepID=A0A6A6FH12_9PEZI|nr:hypothetical protein CERZMDRAFT_41122 [Cercospora zeae-maydis SCOH1-5]